MVDTAACVQPFWAASTVSAVACYTLCSKNMSCAGYVHRDDNNCIFCGVGSNWGGPSDNGASDVIKQWTEPRKCTAERTCLACPQNNGEDTIEQFRRYRASYSELYLSESCLIYWPGRGNLMYGTENQSIELYSNSIVQGPGQLLSPISIVGSNVTLINLTLHHPVMLLNDAKVSLLHVNVLSSAAVVAAKVDFDQVSLDGVAAQETLVALGHASGKVDLKNCKLDTPEIAFVLQEEKDTFLINSVTKDESCEKLRDVNLTRLMNVFGSTYEEMYFNDGSLGTTGVTVGKWLLRTGLANLAAFFVMFFATENLRPILYKLSLPTKKKLQ